jgi:hypothetical protein
VSLLATNSDDPIVFPRQPGAAHQHDFFGNTSTNAYSTDASLAGKPTSAPVRATERPMDAHPA